MQDVDHDDGIVVIRLADRHPDAAEAGGRGLHYASPRHRQVEALAFLAHQGVAPAFGNAAPTVTAFGSSGAVWHLP